MNVNHAAAKQDKNTSLVIADGVAHELAIERVRATNLSKPAPPADCDVRAKNIPAQKNISEQKNISGQIVALQGGCEQPVVGAQVELHRLNSLNEVVCDLSTQVLAHIRALLPEKSAPIDLYHPGDDIADAPLISFADILQLREIPGYELLAAAAKSQTDESFKQQLCSNPAILHPLLRYYHPGRFFGVCTASVTTDKAGYFQFTLQQHTNTDEQPGYRFVVRRPISNSLYITLYNPTPAAWYARWDWSNVDAVTLRTRHPLASRAQPLK